MSGNLHRSRSVVRQARALGRHPKAGDGVVPVAHSRTLKTTAAHVSGVRSGRYLLGKADDPSW